MLILLCWLCPIVRMGWSFWSLFKVRFTSFFVDVLKLILIFSVEAKLSLLDHFYELVYPFHSLYFEIVSQDLDPHLIGGCDHLSELLAMLSLEANKRRLAFHEKLELLLESDVYTNCSEH